MPHSTFALYASGITGEAEERCVKKSFFASLFKTGMVAFGPYHSRNRVPLKTSSMLIREEVFLFCLSFSNVQNDFKVLLIFH